MIVVFLHIVCVMVLVCVLMGCIVCHTLALFALIGVLVVRLCS